MRALTDRLRIGSLSLVAALAFLRCAKSGDFDSESHFFCDTETDCLSHAPNLACVDHHCVPLSGGVVDGGSNADASVQPNVSETDAGTAECFSPPNGWVEQKLSLSVLNSGFYALAGDDQRIAAQAPVPTENSVYPSTDTQVDLYRHTGQTWQPDGILSGTNPNEEFGANVAVDGATVAVSAPNANTNGAVYVFHTQDSAAQLEQRLTNPDPSSSHAGVFGRAIALRGGVLAIGAPATAPGGVGHVYIYEHQKDGTWMSAPDVVSNDVDGQDNFGAIIAFDGTRLVTTAYATDGTVVVYVFVRGPTGFQQEARLTPQADASSASELMYSVALDGDTLLVSTSLGRALVFEHDASGWTFRQALNEAGPANGSAGIAVRGDVAAVGTAEHVQLYERGDAGWRLRDTLHAGDEPEPRGYGSTVVLGPDSVATLAPSDDDFGARSATIYAYTQAPTAHYDLQCVEQTATSGAGTACSRSGVTSALCSHLGSGAGALRGSTPYGPLELPDAWLDVTNGFTESYTVLFGPSSPRREDALPLVSVVVNAIPSLPMSPAIIAVDAQVQLCDQSVTVPAKVVITQAAADGRPWAPLAGTLVIDAPGWNLSGNFTLNAVCRSFDDL